MTRLSIFLSMLLILVSVSSVHASLSSGSLSTPVLYDATAYGKAYAERVPVANSPDGMAATAAWYTYGMRLDWSVTKNSDNTYTYEYKFGPGWYPALNPKGDPYVTNKQITAFDIQLGKDLTMADLIDPHWTVYNFSGTEIGHGGYDNYTDTANSTTGQATMMSVGHLVGETGYSTPIYDPAHPGDLKYVKGWVKNYTTNQLFYGIQWRNPLDANYNYLFSDDTTIEISFKTTKAPGWGNFFTNSWQAGANNFYSDVVAYDSSLTGYDPSMFGSPVNFDNTVAVAGGASVPLPPSLLLMASGLVGMGAIRRRK